MKKINQFQEMSLEARKALQFVIYRMSETKKLTNSQISIFGIIWDYPHLEYPDIGAKIGLTPGSTGVAARKMFRCVKTALPEIGLIDKNNFKATLEQYIAAVNLEIDDNLVIHKDRSSDPETDTEDLLFPAISSQNLAKSNNFDRQFYVKRKEEESALDRLQKSQTTLLKITGKKNTGKTLLINSIYDKLSNSTIGLYFNLNVAGQSNLQNPNNFFKWLCCSIAVNLSLPEKSVDEKWSNILGPLTSATRYFEEYLFQKIDRPLILYLDNLDYLFAFADKTVTAEILGLFRGWSEASKSPVGHIWDEKFRLILIYRKPPKSLEGPTSPLNTGVTIKLSDFSPTEVFQLAKKYNLNWQKTDCENFISQIGSNPYLVRSVFDEISELDISLEAFLQSDFRDREPFKSIFQNEVPA